MSKGEECVSRDMWSIWMRIFIWEKCRSLTVDGTKNGENHERKDKGLRWQAICIAQEILLAKAAHHGRDSQSITCRHTIYTVESLLILQLPSSSSYSIQTLKK